MTWSSEFQSYSNSDCNPGDSGVGNLESDREKYSRRRQYREVWTLKLNSPKWRADVRRFWNIFKKWSSKDRIIIRYFSRYFAWQQFLRRWMFRDILSLIACGKRIRSLQWKKDGQHWDEPGVACWRGAMTDGVLILRLQIEGHSPASSD